MAALRIAAALFVVATTAATADDDFTDRMAREHQNDHSGPSPAAEIEPAAATQAREVAYAELEGTAIQGYLATPAEGTPTAAVVLIHEWWGLNDNVRAMADRFAGEGYAALAIDLYEGGVAEDREGARALMQKAASQPERGVENLRQATAWLRSELGVESVGTVGWCFGGGWSLRAGITQGDDIDAVVIYYGWVVDDPEELAPLTAPVLGHFGEADTGIPVDSVHAFGTALESMEHDATIHLYAGAGHAFANPSGTRYNESAAQISWTRTLEFLDKHLR